MRGGHGTVSATGERWDEQRRRGPGHPAWRRFIGFCEELGHGEIAALKIQDGLPVLAEVTTKKIKFG